MPIYVGYTQVPRRIKVLTAGPDKFFMCHVGDVYLEAVVNDSTNFRNNVIEWSQIDGPAVTLSSTDTLATSFTPPVGDDDLTFRFTVNPGTTRAQWEDVNIYFTPISFAEARVSGGYKTETEQTVPNLSKESSFLFPPLDKQVNSNVLGIPATKFIFDTTSVAGLLNNHYRLEVLGDSNFVANPQTVTQTYELADYPSSITLENGSYIFRVHYALDSGFVAFDSPLLVGNALPRDDYRIVNDVTGEKIALGKASNLVRTTVKNYAVTDNFELRRVAIGQGSSLLRRTNKLVSPDNIPELEDPVSVKVLGLGYGVIGSVVRLDPSNIGNQ